MRSLASLLFYSTVLAVMALPTAAGATSDLASLLPAEVRGYRPQGPDETFDRDSLFDLIDGGAEVYRALNVQRVLSRRYHKPAAAEIMVDVFDMGSSNDAFGAFHHDMREGKDAGVGVESEHQGSSLFFWKHRYFVSVVALADTRSTRAAVLAIAKAIDRKIRAKGTKPDLARMLPERGLVKSQLHYFHDWQLLSRLHSLGNENALHLDSNTEGILARYRSRAKPSGGEASAPAALLLIRYASAAEALEARDSFARKRLGSADATSVSRSADHGWAGARVVGRILIGVLDAGTREQARKLLRVATDAVGRRGKTAR